MHWEKVLLTDSGFYDPFNLHQPMNAIINKFAQMLGKPFCEARVLFIPTAACDGEARKIAAILRQELLWLGIQSGNITVYEIDSSMTIEKASEFDAMFFTGGWAEHLLKRIKETGFDEIIKSFVLLNKVYVGVSAGSVVATPNIMGTFDCLDDTESEALGLINAYIDVHCNLKPDLYIKQLNLPHIMLHSHQALAVSNIGYELIEEPDAYHAVDWSKPPQMGIDVWNEFWLT